MKRLGQNPFNISKRLSLVVGVTVLPLLLALTFPNVVVADDAPLMEQGIQFGDLAPGRAMIWSRADRPARMMVKYAYNDQFTNATTIRGPYAMKDTDFTARQDLVGLPEGKDVFVKVWFEDLTNARGKSEPVTGHFHTIGKRDDIRFIWGGDTAGQGWGINESFGGMKIYEAMRQVKPQFFIQSGDSVYSDGPILNSVTAENGQIWTNLVTPEVSKVAETLTEFRGRYKYNLLDKNLRRFNAEVPQIWQWDDHEVANNWSNSKDLSKDSRYTLKDVPLLVARASKAFHEYAPLRPHDAEEAERIYRKISYGKLLDLFVLDMRTYRGPNTANLQKQQSKETAFLGETQVAWLKDELKHSDATWKVIAADMPWTTSGCSSRSRTGRPSKSSASPMTGALTHHRGRNRWERNPAPSMAMARPRGGPLAAGSTGRRCGGSERDPIRPEGTFC
jgi:alkaline phosphatase D